MKNIEAQSLNESIELIGTVSSVLLARSADSIISVRCEEALLTFEGFLGDKHSGHTCRSSVREKRYYARGTEIRNNRQISLVSEEELQVIAQKMGIDAVLPEWLGANLCLKGIPNLSALPGLTRLVFPSGAVMIVYGENSPCIHPGNAIEQNNKAATASAFVKAAQHKRGLVGWVERPGSIKQGDMVRVYIPPQKLYCVRLFS